jgi:dimethylhistidine N-methyltransferase
MIPSRKTDSRLHDYEPEPASFRADVRRGLQLPRKAIPSKYLYDARGSVLYERICSLEEYYPPRTEIGIMQANISEMTGRLGENTCLLEYGCGNCAKTRILLDNLPSVSAFVPLDISRDQLLRTEAELAAAYPGLEILPVCADYTGDFKLPEPKRKPGRYVVYFPGSTVGNFEPPDALAFLQHIAGVVGPGGALLIGVDLKKDAAVLNLAYNDREGVTAAFNLNLLERINRQLGADFNTDMFRHHAFYNAAAGRIEMHLVSQTAQTVRVDGLKITFKKGESIHTENSYKFSLDDFAGMAAAAGFTVGRAWTDARQWFSVQYLVAGG